VPFDTLRDEAQGTLMELSGDAGVMMTLLAVSRNSRGELPYCAPQLVECLPRSFVGESSAWSG